MFYIYVCAYIVGSSKVAGSAMGAIKGFASTLSLQLGYTIEPQTDNEMPEKLLGAVSIHTPIMQPPSKLYEPPPGYKAPSKPANVNANPTTSAIASTPQIPIADGEEEKTQDNGDDKNGITNV